LNYGGFPPVVNNLPRRPDEFLDALGGVDHHDGLVPNVSKGMSSRVEERRGIALALRFPSPLIKPDVRISRIRLSDWLHDRLTTWCHSVADGAASAYQDRRIPPPS
jgi:hypothetical protein